MKAPTASTEDSDESLMRLIRQGSHQAFAILVRRHTDRFYAGAFRLTGRASEAEDLVQDAFLKIWQKPDIWKDDKGAKFTTWFYRVLVNQNIDRMRKNQKLAPDNSILPFVADGRDDPETTAAMTEEQMRIETALGSLPERQKTAITLCFYEGLSNSEAAGIMGVKIKALESLLMRAKTGLREYLNKNDNHLAKGDRYATR
jgi:RNA polymerase sigma-70 factor (ECF subfamily)